MKVLEGEKDGQGIAFVVRGDAAQSGAWSEFASPCLPACVCVTWGWRAETLIHLGCLLSSANCRYLMCRGKSPTRT